MINKVQFISEIASTHNGKFSILKKLSDYHIKSDSDYLKYQIFKSDNIHIKGSKMYKRFIELEFNFERWKNLIDFYSKKTKIILEPFDYESYEFCKLFKKNVNLKISSSECDDVNLIKDSIKNFKKIWINFSGYKFKEIEKIISSIKKNKKIIPMMGFQSYPTSIRKNRYDIIKYLSHHFNAIGYADHTDRQNSLETFMSIILAIFNNAKYIEKHVCLNVERKPPDYISALEFSEFNKLIKELNDFIEIFNNKKNRFSNEEQKYANEMRKFAFAKDDINKQEDLFYEKFYFLRSEKKGLTRLDFENKKYISLNKINKGSLIDKKNIKKK